jgi:hypothetical protein
MHSCALFSVTVTMGLCGLRLKGGSNRLEHCMRAQVPPWDLFVCVIFTTGRYHLPVM